MRAGLTQSPHLHSLRGCHFKMHNIPQRTKPPGEKLQRGHLLCKVHVVLVSDLSSAPKEAFETAQVTPHSPTVTPQAYEHQEMTLQARAHTLSQKAGSSARVQ